MRWREESEKFSRSRFRKTLNCTYIFRENNPEDLVVWKRSPNGFKFYSAVLECISRDLKVLWIV